ncbi:hypothetical protein TWF730_010517 [Orbilia blumenaviensis]|uniref:Uncharacterized protein n=1 Tax=Orbilia blumenaviensis TaxID=1796055 RepID=A0AAV9UNW5_9PEZI
MQLSRISLVTLLLASFSNAISPDDTVAARDIIVAKAASEAIQKRNLEVRTPKSNKVKGGGGGDEEDQGDDGNAAASIHINMALITGAGAIAVAAIML